MSSASATRSTLSSYSARLIVLMIRDTSDANCLHMSWVDWRSLNITPLSQSQMLFDATLTPLLLRLHFRLFSVWLLDITFHSDPLPARTLPYYLPVPDPMRAQPALQPSLYLPDPHYIYSLYFEDKTLLFSVRDASPGIVFIQTTSVPQKLLGSRSTPITISILFTNCPSWAAYVQTVFRKIESRPGLQSPRDVLRQDLSLHSNTSDPVDK